MQKVERGHDTEWSCGRPGAARRDHAVPSNVATVPVADTTTQNLVEAHDTSWTGLVAVPSATTVSRPQVVPSNRLATPAVSTEAQKVGDTQDTSCRPSAGPVGAGPTATGGDQELPFQVTADRPDRATQKLAEVHETESRVPAVEAVAGSDHVAPFQTMAFPDSSTAAQNDGSGHDTP